VNVAAAAFDASPWNRANAACEIPMTTNTSTAEASIRDVLERQIAGWNAGDAAAWCRDFTPDSNFVNILGMQFEGRDANRQRHGEMFAGIFSGSRLEIVDTHIRMLGDSVAVADLVLDLTGFRALPPGIRPTLGTDVLRTRMHYVLVAGAGRWHIVFSQNTAVMPMPVHGPA
jgi:uncharacterized protein (TIGR02246 family)